MIYLLAGHFGAKRWQPAHHPFRGQTDPPSSGGCFAAFVCAFDSFLGRCHVSEDQLKSSNPYRCVVVQFHMTDLSTKTVDNFVHNFDSLAFCLNGPWSTHGTVKY